MNIEFEKLDDNTKMFVRSLQSMIASADAGFATFIGTVEGNRDATILRFRPNKPHTALGLMRIVENVHNLGGRPVDFQCECDGEDLLVAVPENWSPLMLI